MLMLEGRIRTNTTLDNCHRCAVVHLVGVTHDLNRKVAFDAVVAVTPRYTL